MSTVGCYSMDVYCDICTHKDQFTGRTEAQAIRAASDGGWMISKTENAPEDSIAGGRAARCPAHKGIRRWGRRA